MNDFIYQCALTGVSDYFRSISLPKKWLYNKPPKWMNDQEAHAWTLGFEYAESQMR